jgi:hypothetical protein
MSCTSFVWENECNTCLHQYVFFVGSEVRLVRSCFQIAETYILKVFIHNLVY